MALFIMGFLRTIPSEKLAAVYDLSSQKLILHAKGCVMGSTYGYSFKRDVLFEGLKYNLQAWSGHITGQMHEYDYCEEFVMNLSWTPFLSTKVIVVTADCPYGVEVLVKYVGFVSDKFNDCVLSNDKNISNY